MCLCVCVSNSNWLIVLAAYQFVGWTLLIEQPLQSDTGKCLSVSLSVCVLCDNTLSTHSMQLHGYYYYSLLEVLQISRLWPKAPNFNVFRIILCYSVSRVYHLLLSVSIGPYATAAVNISISYSKLSDFVMQLLNNGVYFCVSLHVPVTVCKM